MNKGLIVFAVLATVTAAAAYRERRTGSDEPAVAYGETDTPALRRLRTRRMAMLSLDAGSL